MFTFANCPRTARQKAMLLLAPAGVNLASRFTFLWLLGYFPEQRSKISVSDKTLHGKIIFEHV